MDKYNELISLNEAVKSLIEEDPIEITPFRYERVPDGAGGMTTSDVPTQLTKLRGRIFNRNSGVRYEVLMAKGGEYDASTRVFVTYPDADLKRDDRFTLPDGEFKVNRIDKSSMYGHDIIRVAEIAEVNP